MKMKKLRFWHRLLLLLSALTALVVGGYLIYAYIFRLPIPFMDRFKDITPYTPPAYAMVGVGLLCVLESVFLFTLVRRIFERRRDFVTQKVENGELRISIKAIENLVQKCVDMHEEIKLRNMRIYNNRRGVAIDLYISLANNISIPLAVQSLQKQIKQYLLASSGIDVQDVRVSVETTKSEAGDSPYLVTNEAKAAEKQPEADKKRAAHQRIFSHSEQAANLPEAPKAEELPKQEEPAPETPEALVPETPVAAPEAPVTETSAPAEPQGTEAAQEAEIPQFQGGNVDG